MRINTHTDREKERDNKQTNKKMLIIQIDAEGPSQLTGPISKTIHVNSIHGNW